MQKRSPFILALVALLASCGGGGASSSFTPVTAPHLPVKNMVSIRVVVPAAGANTSSRLRHILDVAASTQSGTITPYLSTDTSRTSPLEAPQAFSLAAGSSGCTNTTSGRSCTFSVAIPSEPATVSMDLVLRTYDGPLVGGAASGTQIGAGFTTMPGAAPGTTTPTASFTLGSVISKVTLSMPTTALHQILAASFPLYFSAQDADGNAIISTAYTDALGNPATITLASSDTSNSLLIGVGSTPPVHSLTLTAPPTQALLLENIGNYNLSATGQSLSASVALTSGTVPTAQLPLTIIPWNVQSIPIVSNTSLITPTFSPSNYTPGSVAITNKLIADSAGGPYLYFADQDTTQFNIWTATITNGSLSFSAVQCGAGCSGIGTFGSLAEVAGNLDINTTGSTSSAAISFPLSAGAPQVGTPTLISSTYGHLHGGSASSVSGEYVATAGDFATDYLECLVSGTSFTETPLGSGYATRGSVGDVVMDPSNVAWFADGNSGIGSMGAGCGAVSVGPYGTFAGPIGRLAIQPAGLGATAHELVWATEPTIGQSEALDTTMGAIVETDSTGGSPSAIVYDDGYIWVADTNPSNPGLHHDITSGAPTYATQQNFQYINSGHIDAMTLGSDGALYALDTGTDTIYRITY